VKIFIINWPQQKLSFDLWVFLDENSQFSIFETRIVLSTYSFKPRNIIRKIMFETKVAWVQSWFIRRSFISVYKDLLLTTPSDMTFIFKFPHHQFKYQSEDKKRKWKQRMKKKRFLDWYKERKKNVNFCIKKSSKSS